MHKRVFASISAFVFASAFSAAIFADEKFKATAPRMTDSTDKSPPLPDCSRSNTDPRCRPPAHSYPKPRPYPDERGYPYHRPRPVIINQLPAEPAVDTNTLTDDWEGCRTAKLGAIRARENGDSDRANHLDEWLWKNCRGYSYELRELEQNGM